MADDREKQLEVLSAQIKTTELLAQMLAADRASIVISVNQSNVQAMLNYSLQTYSGKITLLKAIDQPSSIYSNPYFGWDKYVIGGVEVHEIPGDHFSMMATPNVMVLAEKLNYCLGK